MSLLWRLLPGVRTAERGRFLFFLSLYGLLSLAQTVGLVGTEAVFLGRIGPEALPRTFVVASLVTVLASLLYAVAVGRARNDVLFVGLLGLAGAFLGWCTVLSGAALFPAVVFCAWFAAQAVFLNHYWTFAADFFDTLAAKRLFPLFTIGGSVGGALGGGIAVALSRVLPAESLIAGWGALLVVAALLLRASRGQIRRWGPLGFEETDEASVEGLRSALRYARRSPMSRWLVVSALAMVMALFVSQFLYSRAFVERFPDPADLAAFFGTFLLVTNTVEVLIEAGFTRWLIQRFGLPTANLVHPLLTFGSFGWLAVDFSLAPAIAARVNRELVENALAAPVRNLVYNALPLRLRGRMRAFLEGIVVYSGMAVAGAALLLMPSRSGLEELRFLCGLGAALAVLYLIANLGVRRAYVGTLIAELRAGRLDLRDVGNVLGGFGSARLGLLWGDLLGREGSASALVELAPLLADRGLIEPLAQATSHPHPEVRRAGIGALASSREEVARAAVLAALDDPEPTVRLTAVRALRSDGGQVARRVLRSCLEDSDPHVRAEAALTFDEQGAAVLEPLARSADRTEAVAALERLPAPLQWLARERVDDADPDVCAAALTALERMGAAQSLPAERIAPLVEHEVARVREAALSVLAAQGTEIAARAIASGLDDPVREVRERASELLGSLGDVGVEAVRDYLRAPGIWTVDAALAALAEAGTPRARDALVAALRRHVAATWEHVLAIASLGRPELLVPRFAAAAHANLLAVDLRQAFRILELLEGPMVVRSVLRALRLGNARARGDALEALSHLGDRPSASLLALLHESGPLEDRIRGVPGLSAHKGTPEDLIQRARQSEDRWLRLAGDATEEAGETRETMERLLALREVPIFGQLRLDQLESISLAMREETYTAGDVICREGEPGSELYLLLEGEVKVWANWGKAGQRQLNRISAPAYFGEMAALDGERRSATIVVSHEARLASLEGDRLKELVLQMPEISFDIFRELIRRVRRAEQEFTDSAAAGPNPNEKENA
jgi:HEAT repeat protein